MCLRNLFVFAALLIFPNSLLSQRDTTTYLSPDETELPMYIMDIGESSIEVWGDSTNKTGANCYVFRIGRQYMFQEYYRNGREMVATTMRKLELLEQLSYGIGILAFKECPRGNDTFTCTVRITYGNSTQISMTGDEFNTICKNSETLKNIVNDLSNIEFQDIRIPANGDSMYELPGFKLYFPYLD